jgi:hypothetical protein
MKCAGRCRRIHCFNKVLEEQGGYKFLDVAATHQSPGKHTGPPTAASGDYFRNPNAEEIETVIQRDDG